MRKFVLSSAPLLVVLFMGLGSFAQEPKGVSVTASPNFNVDSEGCVTVPQSSNIWAITDGAWSKKEVREYLIKVNPFLAEPKRRFNWHRHGRGSGIRISGKDRVCGFVTDAALGMPLASEMERQRILAERDNANARAERFAHDDNFLTLALFIVVIAGLIFHLAKTKLRERRHTREIKGVEEFYIGQLRAQLADIAREVAELVEAMQAAYDPYDGPPVVEGGISPNDPVGVEYAMLCSAYADYAGQNAAFLPFEAAVASNLFHRVGPITFGFMNGDGCIVRNGVGDLAPKNLVNQPGYRTRVAFPNGTEQDVYLLMAGGNPVWIEESDNFTFTPSPVGTEVAPAPMLYDEVVCWVIYH